MYAWLSGEVIAVVAPEVVLAVQGVGYRVTTTDGVVEQVAVGDGISLHVSTQVRENAIELYGFLSLAERLVFERLIKINSVGARTARQILSMFGPRDLAQIGVSGDKARLKQVPGIGPKTAERIVIELRDAITPDLVGSLGLDIPVGVEGSESASAPMSEALAALVGLGFAPSDASARLSAVMELDDPPETVDEMIRMVLQRAAEV